MPLRWEPIWCHFSSQVCQSFCSTILTFPLTKKDINDHLGLNCIPWKFFYLVCLLVQEIDFTKVFCFTTIRVARITYLLLNSNLKYLPISIKNERITIFFHLSFQVCWTFCRHGLMYVEIEGHFKCYISKLQNCISNT